MRNLWQDIRYAIRLARLNPGFTTVAVVSLMLGIGANTVLFSIVYGVLLRPLPYEDPDRLARLVRSVNETEVTMPEFQFWKEHSSVFDSAAASRGIGDRTLVVAGAVQVLSTVGITTDYFRTLGVSPEFGREFNSDETRTGGREAVILTHALWQHSFGSDPSILGRTVALGETAHIVVGILPAGFWFPQNVDVFLPLRVIGNASDTGTNSQMIGRLKTGTSFQRAAKATTALRQQFREQGALPYPLQPDYPGLTPIPYTQWLTGNVRAVLLVILGAVGVLLLVACSNLAGLLLARLSGRQREIAVRLALGSSRPRLVQQFLTENVLLSGVGAIAALCLAPALLPILLSLIPFQLPATAPIAIDRHVLEFAVLIAVGTAALLSLAPCLASARFDIHDSLKAGARIAGLSATKQRVRSALVVFQVALSVGLSIAAVLLSQSLYRVTHQELGFDPHDLVTFRADALPGIRPTPGESRLFENAMLERLMSIAGARSVAAVNVLPLRGQNNFPTQRANHPDQSIGGMEIRIVTPAYFETMGIPIRRGRSFTSDDDGRSRGVIIVNETVARTWWPQENPLGDHIAIGLFQGRPVPGATPDSEREVVGVVGDAKSVYIKAPPRPTVYIPVAEASAGGYNLTWIVRGAPASFAEQLQKLISDLDSRRRVTRLGTMEEIVGSTTTDSRFSAVLFSAFAGLAVVLSAIGIFGLLSFSVSQRTFEIGTRVALGASRHDVLRLVLKQGLVLLALGLALGLAGSFVVMRSLSTLLFGVQPRDIFSYAMGAALLLAAGLVASYLPARYAAKVDPATALRSE